VTFGAANIDRARIRGLETQLGTRLAGWHVQAQLTLLDPRDTGVDYGELLPRIAHYTGRLDVDRNMGAFGVGVTLLANGPRFEDPANTEPLGGYTTLDIRTAWRFAPHWQVQAVLKNAFDRSYETALYYNQLGRSAYLTLRYVPLAS
jgi:vitamin B12 transporter